MSTRQTTGWVGVGWVRPVRSAGKLSRGGLPGGNVQGELAGCSADEYSVTLADRLSHAMSLADTGGRREPYPVVP